MGKENVVSFLIGMGTSVICVSGLYFGVKSLFAAQKLPQEEKLNKKKHLIRGVGLILGQFLIAGTIVIISPYMKENALAFAVGLLSSNLFLPFLLKSSKENT